MKRDSGFHRKVIRKKRKDISSTGTELNNPNTSSNLSRDSPNERDNTHLHSNQNNDNNNNNNISRTNDTNNNNPRDNNNNPNSNSNTNIQRSSIGDIDKPLRSITIDEIQPDYNQTQAIEYLQLGLEEAFFLKYALNCLRIADEQVPNILNDICLFIIQQYLNYIILLFLFLFLLYPHSPYPYYYSKGERSVRN